MAAPAPHAGVALVTALNILEGFNISSHMSRNGTYHWIAEVPHRQSASIQECIRVL